jgi:hypothetical protein
MTTNRRYLVLREIGLYLALALAAYAVYLSSQRLDAVERVAETARMTQIATEREARERRDQMCRLFETDHAQDVERLRRTYAYLVRLTPEQRAGNLNQEVFRGLSQLEEEARLDSAPEFCDEPDVGLAEPDPVIPQRPARLIP